MNVTKAIEDLRQEIGFPLREDLAWELLVARRESRGWGDGIDWDRLNEAVFLDAFYWAKGELRRVKHPSQRRRVLKTALALEYVGYSCETWAGDALSAELESIRF